MKRLLALLLALVLLTGVACAEGLKPRRDAVETPAEESTPSTGPAALPEAETDDLPAAPSTREEEPTRETPDVPAAPEAESPSGLKPRRDEEHHAERHAQDEPDPAADDADARSQTLEGTFTIDEDGVELSYAFSVEMISGAEESALKFSAAPTSGYGMELEGELELPDPMIMMTALYGFGPQRDAPSELLRGTLEARDAFDGATCARYTLTLTGNGILRGEEALRGERWEVDLYPEDVDAFLGDLSAQWLNDLLDLIARNVSALEEGDPLRLSLREMAMPFVRALYSPDSDATVERLGVDRAMLSRALLEAAMGELRLAPTEEDCPWPGTAAAVPNSLPTRSKERSAAMAANSVCTKTGETTTPPSAAFPRRRRMDCACTRRTILTAVISTLTPEWASFQTRSTLRWPLRAPLMSLRCWRFLTMKAEKCSMARNRRCACASSRTGTC